MSENTAHPPALSAPRFLDLGALLPADLAAGPAVLAADRSAAPDNQPNPTLPPLDYLLLADRLGELYEMVFPKEEEWLAEEVGAWREDMDVAQAIGRFLRRVGKLFPVHDEVWEDELEAMEWRLYNIPLTLLGFDIWHDSWLEWPEPARYLIYLMAGRAEDEEERDDYATHYPHLPVPPYLEPHRLAERLRQICAEPGRLPEPLAGFPDLIAMLRQNTGNAFLDIGEVSLAEGGGYPHWSAQEVAWLADEWAKAQPVWERVCRLLTWREGTEKEKAGKVAAVHRALLVAYGQRELELELELEEEEEEEGELELEPEEEGELELELEEEEEELEGEGTLALALALAQEVGG
jgi:hypothetical protein